MQSLIVETFAYEIMDFLFEVYKDTTPNSWIWKDQF